jgi:signal peptidase I
MMKKRHTIVAVLFSLFEPGLGFVYNGKFRIGILITSISTIVCVCLLLLGIFKSFYAAAITIFIYLIFRIVIVINSAFQAKQVGLLQLKRFNRWYVYCLFLLVPVISSELLHVTSMFPQKSFRTFTTGMMPLIQPGECFIADMRYYQNNPILPGDVVTFQPPQWQSIFVQRCVALPGQKLEIRDAIIYVNDQPFIPSLLISRSSGKILSTDYKDKYIVPSGAGNVDQYGPIIIPDSCYFMIGDHRDNSLDSRYFGPVPKQNIRGKALYVYYSDEISRIGMRLK